MLSVLPSQIALRSHGASRQAVDDRFVALGDECPHECEQRGEEQRDPEHSRGGEPRGVLGEREVEDDQRTDDEEEHRRARCPGSEARRARSLRVSATTSDRYAAHAGASESRDVGRSPSRSGWWLDSTTVW